MSAAWEALRRLRAARHAWCDEGTCDDALREERRADRELTELARADAEAVDCFDDDSNDTPLLELLPSRRAEPTAPQPRTAPSQPTGTALQPAPL